MLSFGFHVLYAPVHTHTHTHTHTPTGNVTLPDFQWNGDHYLYTTKCNYVDLNADENGLWAIYSTPKTTNTYVVKVK